MSQPKPPQLYETLQYTPAALSMGPEGRIGRRAFFSHGAGPHSLCRRYDDAEGSPGVGFFNTISFEPESFAVAERRSPNA